MSSRNRQQQDKRSSARENALALFRQGKLVESLAVANRAQGTSSPDPILLNLAAMCHMRMGHPEQAKVCWQQALHIKPDFVEVSSNLGNCLQQLQSYQEAEAAYRQALHFRPDYTDAIYNLALLLQKQKRFDEAVAAYRQILSLEPGRLDACYNLGNILKEQKCYQEAEAAYRQVLRIQPDFVGAIGNLGNLLKEQQRFEEAEAAYRQLLRIKPDYAEAYNNLGNLLQELRRDHEAEAAYRQALRLKPNHADACNNLALLLQEQKRYQEAETAYRQALRFQPNDAEICNNFGNLLQEQQRFDEAEACYQQALRLRPDHGNALSGAVQCAREQCRWEPFTDHLLAIRHGIDRGVMIEPFTTLAFLHDSPSAFPTIQQRRCAEHHVREKFGHIRALSGSWHWHAHHDRLKIGYLSHDFQDHPAGYVAADLLASHNRNRFEVMAYSHGADDGQETRKRIMQACDRFVDIGHLPDEAAARAILDDGVHILVEMNGHTKGSRLSIAAYRPAPIQVSLLGYPGSVGAPFIDYLVTSHFAVPPGLENGYSEKIVRLPNHVMPNDYRRKTVTLQNLSRQTFGLPAKGFVFANFNANYKITPAIFDIWMSLLRQTPASVLWLWHSNPLAATNLKQEALARGVADHRLIFAPLLPYADHLSLFSLVDLFLDTYPYGASSTASDALWAGCPVLTCAGSTLVSRMAGSLLMGIGLPELVVNALTDYAALALALAHDPERLTAIRNRLHHHQLARPLLDTPGWIPYLEHAYETMWQRFRAGEQAVPI